MEANFDDYTLSGSHALADLVDRRIDQLDLPTMDGARRQIETIARLVGMSLADQLSGAKCKGRVGRYRNVSPADPREDWNGFGRKLKWLVRWTEAGKPLEDLRV